jgi:phage terminase Nu1 subunit (DNA packaging protein)
MQDYLAALERLRKDAADAALIRDLATDKVKQDFFDLLHRHLDQLADEVERAVNTPKTA